MIEPAGPGFWWWSWNFIWLCLLWVGMAFYLLWQQRQDRQTEKLYAKVYDELPLPMAIMRSRDAVFVSANQEFQRLTRLSLGDLLGKTHQQVGFEVEPAEAQRFYACILAQKHVRDYELTVRFCGHERILLIASEQINFNGEACLLGSFQNITARKQAEERFTRAFYDNAVPMSIVRADSDVILEVNRAYLTLTGWAREDVIGKTCAQAGFEFSVADYQNALAEMRSTGQLKPIEVTALFRTGAKTLISSASLISFNGLECVLWSEQDITERKYAEAAAQRWHSVFSQTDFGLAHASVAENTFLDVNEAYARARGYTRAELIGQPVLTVFPPELHAVVKQSFQRTDRAGHIVYETLHQRKDGSRFPVFVEANVIKDEHGQPVSRIVYALDITERKQAEEELRVSEERFAAAFNASPDAMAITTFDEGRFVLVNDAWVRIFGISRAAALGQQFQNLNLWIDAEQRNDVFKQVRSTGSVVDYEVHGQTAEGQPRTLLITAKLITLGAETFVLSVSRCITERKRFEVELQTSQAQLRNLAGRLQTIREEERAAIAREIHDELGQALTGIKMDLKWLEQLLPPAAEPARERLASIYSLIGNTVQSVRQLATSLRPGVLDDFGLAAALEWQARDFTARTGIACEFEDLPEELPLESAHATALFRIFQEALTNVARHAEAGQVCGRLTYENNTLDMQIHDNGKGINANEIEHSRSLGLVGMRERALLLGGAFSIAGRPGAGTTITVQIPLATHSEPAPAIPASTHGEPV